jgi:hypothetical protein
MGREAPIAGASAILARPLAFDPIGILVKTFGCSFIKIELIIIALPGSS